MAKPHEDPRDLFWRMVDKSGECWLWKGSISKYGYGKFQLTLPRPKDLPRDKKTPQRVYVASRYSWEISNGHIPDGMFVCHKCDNPKCVRPDHLFLGSQKDNRVDAANKKRTAWGERHPHSKLTETQVHEIRVLGKSLSSLDIAKRYGVSHGAVYCILNGLTWRHLGQVS